MSERPLLEIVDLLKTFPVRNPFGRQKGEVRAVDGVSFSIARGEVFGLAGESGSGKSTIARMIMGLTRPTGGDIVLNGENSTGAAGGRAHGRKVQMVFQNPGSSLNPRRTVGQSITVPLAAHGLAQGHRRDRVAELLEMVQLPAEFSSRYPHELSGGQKQRVAIARALMLEPKLMLFDEVTSALDPEMVIEVQNVMLQLAEQKMAMIIVTHDLHFARHIATRVVFCANGKVVEQGPPEQIFSQPREARTREFLEKVVHLD